MDWLHWHLLDQIATETDQSLLIFSPFCSLVSLLMPAQCLLVCTRILKETWRNACLDWKKTESRGNAGQKLVVQKSSFKFPSSNWHDTRSLPAIFFAVSNLVQSSRYKAGVIWLQSSQSMSPQGFFLGAYQGQSTPVGTRKIEFLHSQIEFLHFFHWVFRIFFKKILVLCTF